MLGIVIRMRIVEGHDHSLSIRVETPLSLETNMGWMQGSEGV